MLDEAAVNDEVNTRHRRERKELQARIQALKKTASKNDKRKRKDIMEEVNRLEKELEERQVSEKLSQLAVQNNNVDAKAQVDEDVDVHDAFIETTDENPPQRVSKAQKRRNRKERDAKQREEHFRAAAREARLAPKAIETSKILNKLRDRDLCLYEIPSDGDCLYNAVRHQLQLHGLGSHTVAELRCETANYIHANKGSLIHYMTNAKSGELLNDEEFESYCEAVRCSPAWGGQVELNALSSVLKVPIEVLQAEGPPTVQGSEEFAGPNLTITYHRHMFSLGEHYNSTMPATGDESE